MTNTINNVILYLFIIDSIYINSDFFNHYDKTFKIKKIL